MSDDIIKKFKNSRLSNNLLNLLDQSNGIESSKKGSKIHIKKENRGKFTEAAKNADMSIQEFASYVLSNKDRFSPKLVKRANFARNAKSFNH